MKSQFRILVLGDEVGLKPKGNITCVYECVCFCVCVFVCLCAWVRWKSCLLNLVWVLHPELFKGPCHKNLGILIGCCSDYTL